MSNNASEEKSDYERCFGEYHPLRDYESLFGWGICHAPTKRIFGYMGAKHVAFAVSAMLNGEWEAAKTFMGNEKIPNDYFARFKSL